MPTARALVLCRLAACALLTLSAAGCGLDPVRADLERYERVVLRPLGLEDARGAEELAELTRATDQGRLERSAARTAVQSAAAHYAAIETLLKDEHPASPDLARLHARLSDEYRVITHQLDEAGAALERGDWHRADELLLGLAGHGFDAVRPAFAELARAHGLDPSN